MEELSLVISNPTDKEFISKIEWNKDEIKEAVMAIVKDYDGVQYSEEQIQSAKKDRADLNKLKKALNDKRLEVKRRWIAPYEEFEKDVKELTEVIDETGNGIDAQVKEYEARIKAEKKESLEMFFAEIMENLDFDIPFEKVFEDRYLNQSFSLKKGKDEITAKIDKIKSNLATLSTIDNEFLMAGKDTYLRTLDMTIAIQEMTRLTGLKKKEEEEIQKKLEEKLNKHTVEEQEVYKTELQQKELTNHPANEEKPKKEVSSNSNVVDPFKETQEKIYRSSFMIKGTKEQILSVKKFLNDNNIWYGKVE